MLSVKTLIRTLTTSLCLLLAMPSPGMAGESPFESLPVGAKARLGRGWITDTQYSPDGTRLAVGSSVGIWLYDTQTYEVASLLTGHAYGVAGMAFSPDGRTLAVAGRDDTIRLWNPDTGTLRHIPEDPSHSISGSDTSLAFSPDGRILASAPRSNTVHLWDAAEGTLRRTLEDSGAITSLAFSPNGRILAIGGWASSRMERGAVRLWDVTSTVQSWAVNTDILLYTLKSHTQKITSLAFSPDGRTLAAGGRFQRKAGPTQPQAFPDGQTLQLWDPDTGTLRRTLEVHPGGILSVAFSPDGRTLASASWYNTVHFWDTATHTLSHTLTGHKFRIDSLAFSSDGRTLVSGGWDSGGRAVTGGKQVRDTVRLWDVATGSLRHMLADGVGGRGGGLQPRRPDPRHGRLGRPWHPPV